MSIQSLFNPNDHDLYCATLHITDKYAGASTNLFIEGDVHISGDTVIDGTLTTEFSTLTTDSTSTSTGSLIVNGGLGVAKTSHLNTLYVDNTNNSTDINSGSSVILGGVGIKKDLYVGGVIYGAVSGGVASTSVHLSDTTESSSVSSGTLIVDGGAGIAKRLNVGGDVLFESTTISTSSSTGSLICGGGVGVGGDLYVSGTITGNSTINGDVIFGRGTAESLNVSSGSIVALGGCGIAKNLNIGGDMRITSTNNSTDPHSGALICDGGAGLEGDLYVGGTIYGFVYGGVSNTSLILTDTTESTSSSVGTLVVHGGIGCAKNLNIGGNVSCDNIIQGLTVKSNGTYDSSSPSTGSMVSMGGIGINKSLYVGGTIKATSTTNSTDSLTGSFICDGGVGVSGDLYVGGSIHGNFSTPDMLNLSSTVDSSSISTGSITTLGGMGIAQNVYIGKSLNVPFNNINGFTIYANNTTEATNPASGAIVTLGGVGIAKDINMGGNIHLADEGKLICGGIDTLKLYNSAQIEVVGTNQANSLSSGALHVNGGCSIQKNLYVGEYIYSNIVTTLSTTEATDPASGSLLTSGGIGCLKSIHSLSYIKSHSTTESTDINTGSIIALGGIGCAKNLNVGGEMTIFNDVKTTTLTTNTSGDLLINCSGDNIKMSSSDTVHVLNTIQSTSSSTGSLLGYGGVGIAKNLNIGGNTNISSGNFGSDYLTGSLVVAGSIGMSGNMYANGSMNCIYGIKVQGVSQPYEIYTENDNTHQRNYGNNIWYHENISTFNDTNESININTGSVICKGGLGVTKSIYVGGITNILNTTQTTSISTGALVVSGGIGCGSLNINTPTDQIGGLILNVGATKMFQVTSDGNYPYLTGNYDIIRSKSSFIITAVGVGAYNQLSLVAYGTNHTAEFGVNPTNGVFNINSSADKITFDVTDVITVLNTTQATSTSTGSLIVSGGLGVAKDIYCGANLNFSSTLTKEGVIITSLSASPPTVALLTNIFTYSFSASAENIIYGQYDIDHDWAIGTSITPHIHWCNPNTNAGNIVWQLVTSINNIGSAFNVTGSTQTITVANDTVTAYKHIQSSFPAIVMSGTSTDGTILCFRLSRLGANAGDTYGSVSHLVNFSVHYTANRFGSV